MRLRQVTRNGDPYRVSFAGPHDGPAARALFRFLEAIFGAGHCANLHRKAHRERRQDESIWTSYVRLCRLRAEARMLDDKPIPATGPLLIVANHPTGIPDAAILGHLIDTQVRRDARFVVGDAFAVIPGLNGAVISLHLPSTFGNSPADAPRRRAKAFVEVRDHLKSGGAVVLFPSGPEAVVHKSGALLDAPWRKSVFQLAMEVRASVTPVFIGARISRLRLLCRMINKLFYDAAASYEVRHMTGRDVLVSFGTTWSPEELGQIGSAEEIARHLRHETYGLGGFGNMAAATDQAR